MSDDLTPVEQARAARWAADVADEAGDHGTAKFFRRHADRLDPPESVESLRAERDKALADRMDFQRERYRIAAELDTQSQKLDAAMADVTHWREQFRLVCDESEDRKNDLVRLRATHTEAEAAWERSKRQPRVWHKGDPEPLDISVALVDPSGQKWWYHEDRDRWIGARYGVDCSWVDLLELRSTLTEVLP